MRIDDSTDLTHQRVHTVPRKDKGTGPGETRQILRRTKPFIGWDGEGYTVAGTHHYALFGNSQGDTVTGRLSWRQCLPLLFAAPKNAHHVIYAGTYDCVMMFHDTPVVNDLLHGKTVYLEQYRITYLRGKMLRVTDRERKETRTLFDVFTFFGTSFVKACREYLGDSETLAEIERMKLQRNTFTPETLADGSVRGYMGDELRLLVELCSALRDRLALVNIHPHQWHGPGAVASTVLKMHHVAKHKGKYDDRFRKVAESAYYGGRFEQFQRGTVVGTIYQYDIRSAYPDAMRFLPSLTSCEWRYREDEHGPEYIDPFGLYHVQTKGNGHPYGYLPYRNKVGSIYYPQWVDGWYWGIELPEWMTPPANKPHVTEWYHPVYVDMTQRLDRPFRFVAEMYEQRAKLKRANQPHQLALKLALNSLYGKLAQSKGAKQDEQMGEWKYPTFHEIVWAGWITAYTRRKISDALHSVDPASIIATETDSVFTLVPLPVEVGQGLGQWDCDELDGIKYIQSGVSLVKRGDEWSFKTRGFTVKRTENEVDIWSDFLAMSDPVLKVKQTRFGTDPRQQTFGRWYETIHHLRLDNNPLEKRIHSWCPACEHGSTYGDALHQLIIPPIPQGTSTPYRFVWRNAPPTEMAEMVAPLADLFGDEPLLKLEYVT